MPDTRLLLVRHGQTAWNTEMRMQGHLDSPLTELGLKQAAALAEALVAWKPAALYSSSSGRALTTADVIAARLKAAGHTVSPHPRAELREIRLGAWEGQTKAEIHARYGQAALDFWQAPDKFVARDGAEGYLETQTRVWEAVQGLAETHRGQTLALVSHGVALQLLLARAENQPLAALWQDKVVHQASLSCLVWLENGEWTVEFRDRRDHLDGLVQTVRQVV